jgi:hypothetical protein
MNRRLFLISGIAAACVTLSACVTPKLFNDKEYTEKIMSFMITADDKKLVVIGERYHYIFDMPDGLLPVLKADYRKILNSSFYNFHVHDSAVDGRYDLTLPQSASAEDKQQAIADGFKVDPFGNIRFEGEIQGTRYSAADFEQKLTAQPFNQNYTVGVTETLSTIDKGVRMLATPVTVAADGVLMLGGVLLIPVVLVSLHRHGLPLF